MAGGVPARTARPASAMRRSPSSYSTRPSRWTRRRPSHAGAAAPLAALRGRSGLLRAWMASPSAALHASMKASGKVGWACTVSATSSTEAAISSASAASATRSEASGPTMVAPRSSFEPRSATTFTKPSVWAMAMARPSAAKPNFPVMGSIPCARASSSERPTVATSGSVKMAAGMATQSRADFLPAMTSAAISPSFEALCASSGGPGQVADAVDGRDVRLHALVHRDEAARPHGDPGRFQVQASHVRLEPDRDQHLVAGQLTLGALHLDAHGQPAPLALHALRLGRRRAPRPRARAAPWPRAAPPPGRHRPGWWGAPRPP